MTGPKMQKVPVTFVTGIHPEEISYRILATAYIIDPIGYRIDHHEESTSGLIATPRNEDQGFPRSFRSHSDPLDCHGLGLPDFGGALSADCRFHVLVKQIPAARSLPTHFACHVVHVSNLLSFVSFVKTFPGGIFRFPLESVNYRRAFAFARISAGVGGALTSAESSLRSFRRD